ncbi:MAG: serine hydrolase domain-containing protein [Terriglobales bacterium]
MKRQPSSKEVRSQCILKCVRALLLVTVAVFAQSAPAADDMVKSGLDMQRLGKIHQRMQEFVNSGQAAGIVTLVQQDGKTVETDAVGLQNIEQNKAMRPDSIFQIMSMTKPFTAVGIMMLAEEGKISLYDDVETYLPEFRVQPLNVNGWMKRPARPIRIYDLLSHTSGMRNDPQGAMRDLYQTMDHTLADAVKEYAKEPLEFEPGTKWLYSNPGIATLGRIIEVVSGQSYENFIETRLLRPLQMKDTFFFPPADMHDRIAMVYMPRDGKLSRAGPEILGGDPAAFRKNAKYPAPEFGLFSTAEDLSHFCQMILNNGSWKGARFLSPVTVETMQEVQTSGMRAGWYPGADYGLAWEIVNKPLSTLGFLPKGSFGHGGAFGTHEWIIPKRNMITIFMTACEGDCSDLPERAFQEMVAASVQ